VKADETAIPPLFFSRTNQQPTPLQSILDSTHFTPFYFTSIACIHATNHSHIFPSLSLPHAQHQLDASFSSPSLPHASTREEAPHLLPFPCESSMFGVDN
jgi:hypothetical protein